MMTWWMIMTVMHGSGWGALHFKPYYSFTLYFTPYYYFILYILSYHYLSLTFLAIEKFY